MMSKPILKTRIPIVTETTSWIISDIDKDIFSETAVMSAGIDWSTESSCCGLVNKKSGKIIMSNCQMEVDDFCSFWNDCFGHLVIAGLGGGFILESLIKKDSVESITVLEKDPELCELLSPLYPEVKIINVDAFEFQKTDELTYDFAWLDIWDTSGKSEYNSMCSLKKKFQNIAENIYVWGFDRASRE